MNVTDSRFLPPLRASHHCRHYTYERCGKTLLDGGPRCALGVMGATVQPCMPDPSGSGSYCPHRAEYTDEERAAYDTYVKEASTRTMTALGALNDVFDAPEASGAIECPNCGGSLTYWRKGRHGQFMCETANCCGGYLTLRDCD